MNSAFVAGFTKAAGLGKNPALPKSRSLKTPAAAAQPQKDQNDDLGKRLKRLSPILDDIPQLLRGLRNMGEEVHV